MGNLGLFLLFWWHCILIGLKAGYCVFGSIEGFCGLILASLLWREKWHKYGKEKENLVKKWAVKVAGISFVLSTIFVAPVIQWHDSESAKLAAIRELESKSAKLDGFIDQFMAGDLVGTTNSIILVQATVGNSGNEASVADYYELKAVLTNKSTVDAELIDFSDEYKLNALETNGNIPILLKRSELISEKTSKALRPGDEQRGWIAFRLPGIPIGQLQQTNCRIVLSFADINGKRIFVTNGFINGKPAKKIETINFPRTLPGSGNLVDQAQVKAQQAMKPGDEIWLPPELPSGCSNVTVFFGAHGLIYPLSMAQISTEKSGTKVQIKDLPEAFLTDLDKTPGYSPLNRNMWLRWAYTKQDYGGKMVSIPIFPFVTNNHLFVEVEIPFLNQRRKIVMSDQFDTELSKLPRGWDRNYSTNFYVYEIVNEHTNPVLQVFYTKPNEVHINGIFVVDTNSVLESFGEPPQLHTIASYKLMDRTNMQEITNISSFLGTNSVEELITNAFYNLKCPLQKTIFKYPSNRHPSVFAE